MWPLGHLAVGYLAYSLWRRARDGRPPRSGPVVVVLFASQLPDLIDKPLAWYFEVLPTGRTLGHSLLVMVPLCLLVLAIARHRDRLAAGVAFVFGVMSHLLVDAMPALWRAEADATFLLWPLLPPVGFENGAPEVTAMLLGSLTQPWFLFEFVLAGLALALWLHDGRPGFDMARHALERVGTDRDRGG